MNRSIPPVRKTRHVKASVARAFEVFTSGLPRWWPLDIGVGKAPRDKVLFEPRLGGRWLEVAVDGTETVVATVVVWEPPRRLVLLWHVNGQMQPDLAMRSEVEVRFAPDGAEGTLVELVHHKFESLGPEDGPKLRDALDKGWPELFRLFAERTEFEAGNA